mmetsp:Transcript_10863/g.24249  ORF Transcript_10863/g.24249 Transcript_10863/m.24249 type:complete len:890 (+) Transcript_10863:3-2672(+)
MDSISIHSPPPATPLNSCATTSSPTLSPVSRTPPMPPKPPEPIDEAPVVSGDAEVYMQPSEGSSSAAFWEWSDPVEMMAVVEPGQLLRVLNGAGKTIYRVQLPKEGRVIFLGWEPSGCALAAVQNHGGAFLWFPSRPDSVQQWEGMQFSSQLMKSSVLKRNSHFNTCFACWSPASKLVLGLHDGNFAVWDLKSNETFISRKHFAGKHKNPITCGAWGLDGQILALGSVNMLKVSQPLNSASWEVTAAKLSLPENDLSFQELSFSHSSGTLAALAGSSVFRHLCVYSVRDEGKKKGGNLEPVGEIHPNTTIGAIAAIFWIANEVMAVATTNGFIILAQYDQADGVLVEDQHKVCDNRVAGATYCKDVGHLAIADQDKISFFDPLYCRIASSVPLPPAPDGNRYTKLQCAGASIMISRSDGYIIRVKMPPLQTPNLELLTVSRGNKAETAEAANAAMLPGTCSSIKLVTSVSPSDGATSSAHFKLMHSFSREKGLLAFANSENELVVKKVTAPGGDALPAGEHQETLSREELPKSNCSYFEWDPSFQNVLAIGIRGFGIAMYTPNGSGTQMWAGMQYKSGIVPIKSSQKTFDPIFAKWNNAGQLAAGMADGTFAVYDSVSSQIFVGTKSGTHNNSITAGDWLSSLFAPALALASMNVIKVSQAFDNVEWSATALKLKLGKEGERTRRLSSPSIRLARSKSSASVSDPEGLCFEEIRFSPSGKYLATLAAPKPAPSHKHVTVYEIQDQRESLVPVRDMVDRDVGSPFGFSWIENSTLLIFCRASSGREGSCVKTMVIGGFTGTTTWPPPGVSAPGWLVAASATTQGLLALVFDTGDKRGCLQILACPAMKVLAEQRLDGTPESMSLRPGIHGSSFISIAYQAGGLELFELVP